MLGDRSPILIVFSTTNSRLVLFILLINHVIGGSRKVEDGNSTKMSKTRDKNASSSKASLAEQQAHANPAADSATATVLLQAIESLKTELKQDNTRVRQDITLLQQELSGKLDTMAEDLRGLTDRVEEAESRVGRVEDVTLDLAVALAESMKRQKGLRDKLTDLESRSRRYNIRIFGVDEGEKPTSMAKFVADLLQRQLALPADLDLKIQRAHRALSRQPSASPRPIIVNFQEFAIKEMILKEAWKKGVIQLNGRNIFFDHDYASEVIQKRKEYQKIKKVLKEKGIRFQTPYTNMRIHWEDGAKVYCTARKAGLELRRRGLEVTTRKSGSKS